MNSDPAIPPRDFLTERVVPVLRVLGWAAWLWAAVGVCRMLFCGSGLGVFR